MIASSISNRMTTTAPTGAPITMPRLQGTILEDLPSEHNAVGVADIAEVAGSIDGVNVSSVVLTGQVLSLAHRGGIGLYITLLALLQLFTDEELNMIRP